MSAAPAVRVESLVKRFGGLTALNELTFSVEEGEIYSLLGPNGAGKSTTISILAGLLQPDHGEAHLLGRSLRTESRAARALLGFVPQEIALYPDLSARENLMFWGRMVGLGGQVLHRRVDEVLEKIGLQDRKKDRVAAFSGGMKRRVNIGAALLHHPRIMIMDEPTVGIDPQTRRSILDSVKELNRQGMTVLYTTHYMEEAQELSSRIGIMDHGRLIASGTHSQLLHLVGEQTRVDLTLNAESGHVCDAWRQVEGVSGILGCDGRVTVLMDDSNRVLPRLFEVAGACQVRITSIDIQEPDLEAVFLHLTGRALRD